MDRWDYRAVEDAPDFTQPVSLGISLMPRYVVQRGSSLHSAREDSMCAVHGAEKCESPGG